MRALLATLLLIFTATGYGAGLSSNAASGAFPGVAPATEFLRVEEAYRLAVELQPDNSIRLYWQIEDSYYLYQHRFSFDLKDEGGAIDLAVDLPPALDRHDEYFGDVSVYYHDADVLLTPARTPGRATLSISSQGCADAGLCYPPFTQHFKLDFSAGTVSAISPPKRPQVAGTDATSIQWGNLLYMLLLAFVGGSILNLMPCVFPVLSLKMLSFARSADHPDHTHSWVYASGVIASFVLVAAVLIFIRQAGAAVGWGFHLQSPGFVIAMAYLFVAMALSLSGLIELGSSIMGTGSELADREGLGGSFFTGVLAVVVASPCTAPFMGTALGFAATQPAVIALGVFAALGAGMAAPMVALSYSSGLRRMMPKPGPWMETFKQLLAFPLYATAVWLFWVVGRQTGVNTMAIALLGALLIGLGFWLWRYPRWGKSLAVLCIVVAAGFAGWRGLDESTRNTPSGDHETWSQQRLEELQTQGRPVFVDVTADWCISCIANEQAVLLTDEISAAFKAKSVTYMVADWTNYDADIAAFLKQHGRNGIPFYILYSGDPSRPPQVLPQILTKSTVLQALSTLDIKTDKNLLTSAIL
ncbi:MAG: protein-disulfide reductase DsbD [Halioglobus sp.]